MSDKLKELIKEVVLQEVKRKWGRYTSGDIMVVVMTLSPEAKDKANKIFPDNPEMNYAYRKGFREALVAVQNELSEMDDEATRQAREKKL